MSTIDDLVEQARAAIAGDLPTAATSPRTAADADGSRYAGTSADGRVRAEVTADGRVARVAIEPEALRHPLDDVLAAAVEAINAARAARPGRLDLSGAVELVGRLQAVAQRDLAAYAGAVEDVEARVRSTRDGRDGRDSRPRT